MVRLRPDTQFLVRSKAGPYVRSSSASWRSRSAIACSSMARCAGAHARCKSLSAPVRANINVARAVRLAVSSGLIAGRASVDSVAASCCCSTDLLSQPRAIRVHPTEMREGTGGFHTEGTEGISHGGNGGNGDQKRLDLRFPRFLRVIVPPFPPKISVPSYLA